MLFARPLLVRSLLIAIGAALSGCSTNIQGYVDYNMHADPIPAAFHVCHGYGCREKTKVALKPEEWARVRAQLEPPAASAAEERQQVAMAVAWFETVVAPYAGTAGDEAGARLFNKELGQLDCVDETVNTVTLLTMLDRDGLIRWHHVGPAAHRGHFYDRWPHNTAVLRTRQGNEAYAIDSWFYANAVPAAIVPLEAWLGGWSPENPEAQQPVSALAGVPPS